MPQKKRERDAKKQKRVRVRVRGGELVRNLITAPKTLMSNDGWNRWMDGLANKVN